MRKQIRRLLVVAGAMVTAVGVLWWSPSTRSSGGGAQAMPLPNEPSVSSERELPAARQPVADDAVVQEPWFHGAPVGRRLRFRVEWNQQVAIQTAVAETPTRATSQGARLSGELVLQIGDRRRDEILFAVDFAALHAEALDAQAPEQADHLAAALRDLTDAVWVRAGVDGQPSGYVFPAGCGLRARNLARSVVAAISFAVPADAGNTWVAREADAAGEFDALYSADLTATMSTAAVAVVRSKSDYASAPPQCLAQRTLRGRGRAVFARDLGWLSSAWIEEKSTVELAGTGVRIDTELRGKLDLLDASDGAALPNAFDWDAPWAAVRGDQEDSSAVAAVELARGWRHRLAGVPLADLVAQAAALLSSTAEPGQVEKLFERLAWLIRLESEQAAAVRALIEGQQVNRATAELLLSALGAAGTEEAQQALLGLRGNEGLEPALRSRATIAMFQIAEPTPQLIAAVFDSVGEAASFGELEATSLLLLGALSMHSDGGVLDGLVAFEERAREVDASDVWLEALGNAGTPRALELVKPYLESNDEGLRASAVTALRRLRTPAAAQELGRVALLDAAAAVRCRAVEELAAFPPHDSVDVLSRVLSQDHDASVRCASLFGLGAALDDPRAQQALQSAATADPERDLRALAAELLQPRPRP